MALNRVCMCCHEKYAYCPDCNSRDKLKPAWHASFCSEACKDLWTTLSGYSMGFIEKKDAVETIKALTLKDKSQYVECVQRDMAKLLAEEPKLKRSKKVEPKIVNEIDTPVMVEDNVAPKAAKTPVVEKTETTPIIEKIETTPAPEKAEIAHEVVTKTEEK